FAPLTAPRASAAVAPASSPLVIPITGTGSGGSFSGIFTLSQFAVQNGQLMAIGTLSGTVSNTTGALGSILRTAALPVSNITASCEILHLELGPLDLNLLGVMIHLNQIVLDISAQPGPGNLLGNLLCSVAGLLDN